jgi:DNA-binding HxlR family transcriptional regulator
MEAEGETPPNDDGPHTEAADDASVELLRQLELRRGNVYAPDCPSRALLDHLTSRWGVLVMVVLSGGPRRFSELTAMIGGISDKMLSQTLKALAADGFITRAVEDGPPVRVAYGLTEPGREASGLLAELISWLELNVGALMEAGAENE